MQNSHIQGGRWVNAVVLFMFDRFGVHPVLDQHVGFFMLVASIAICTTIIAMRIKDVYNNASNRDLVVLDIMLISAFVNVFFAEMFHFPEMTYLIAIGLFLSVLACSTLTKNWSVRGIIASCILVSLSFGIYQVLFIYFIIISICLLLIQCGFKLRKESVIKVIQILGVGLIGVILSLTSTQIIIRVLGLAMYERSSIGFNPSLWISNIRLIVNLQYPLFNSALNLVPGSRVAWSVGIILLVGGYGAIASRIKNNMTYKDMLFTLVMLLGGYASVFIAHVVSPTFWPVPRQMVPFFAWVSILSVLFFVLSTSKTVKGIILAVSIYLLLANAVFIQQIAADNLIVNALDRQHSVDVIRHIEQHERDNNVVITQIAIQGDMSPTWFYTNHNPVRFSGDMNIRAWFVSWSIRGLLYSVSGREFEIVDMDIDIFNHHFYGRNWSRFIPEEQMIFVEDTLYMILY